jgi:hypothetical protein
MTTITVTIQGDEQEIRELLPFLFAPAPVSPQVGVTSLAHVIQLENPLRWKFAEFARYWERIKPGARRFLQEVAKQPDGYHAEELKQELDWDHNHLAGTLTSLKFQLRLFPGKPEVYFRDRAIGYANGHTYRIEPYIVEFIGQLTSSNG